MLTPKLITVMLKIDMEENTTAPALKEWPGAFGLFKVSRDGVRKNVGTILVLWIGIYVVNFLLGFVLALFFGKTVADVVGQPLSIVISIWFAIAFARALLASARYKRIDLNQSLTISGKLFWNMLLLELLLVLSIAGGLILLIVPGIIIGSRLSLAQYYLVDRDCDALEAYKASWRATKGHLGKVFGIVGVAILMILPVITIIGIILTVYWIFMYSAAGALLYLFLSKHKAPGKTAE